MSEHVALDGPPAPAVPAAPAWLRQRFLAPGERVAWWQGPTESDWVEWLKSNERWVLIIPFGSFFVFTLAGVFVGPAGFILGAGLSVCLMATFFTIVGNAEKHKWLVLTDRRLFVVTGRKKTEEFDLVLLRQLLGSLGSAGPLPASQQVVDLGKVGAIGPSSQAVTDLASVLAMAKLMRQVQGAGKVMPS